MRDLASHYDDLYRTGYRTLPDGFEVARMEALRHFIPRVARITPPTHMLDYGAGSGLYLPFWRTLFPAATLHGCDISAEALRWLQKIDPGCRVHPMPSGNVAAPDGAFDLVVSIEVLEHVADLPAALRDIHRLLKPGGCFVWTTPCANPGSLEHTWARLTGNIIPTAEGFRRFAWEDRGHLRRLTGGEMHDFLAAAGFQGMRLRYRAHLFSFLLEHYWRMARLPDGVRRRLYCLDYDLFRHLPFAASMLGAAWKR